jgi:hypothetical protein
MNLVKLLLLSCCVRRFGIFFFSVLFPILSIAPLHAKTPLPQPTDRPQGDICRGDLNSEDTINALEAQPGRLRQQQFSTTVKLQGSVVFSLPPSAAPITRNQGAIRSRGPNQPELSQRSNLRDSSFEPGERIRQPNNTESYSAIDYQVKAIKNYLNKENYDNSNNQSQTH